MTINLRTISLMTIFVDDDVCVVGVLAVVAVDDSTC